jgi:hypothetical protein
MNDLPESGPPPRGEYLYAIAALGKDRAYDMAGIDGAAVFSIRRGPVAAVVSLCARQKLRPERAHLAAHREVLNRLMQDETVLPMAFGTIADDARAVRRLLSLNQEMFLQQLGRVAGKVEMGLRVKWDVANIFEYFIGIHPELRVLRDRLLGNQREPSQEDKIQLGQFFEQTLEEDRDAVFEKLEVKLAPCCAEIKRSPPRQANEAANLNLLAGRDRQAQLEEAVFQAAHLFDNNFAFDLSGPWAPHNFVEMDLQLEGRN